jgi:polyhydroxyalkanoate synthase subunit PhaC
VAKKLSESASPARDATNRRSPTGRDSELRRQIERALYAQLALVTGGLAPDDYAQAWWEWYLQLTARPDQQLALAQSAIEQTVDTVQFAMRAAGGQRLAHERDNPEFGGATWNEWPFNVFARTYGNWASWWQQALGAGSEMSGRNADLMRFISRQMLDAASPANFLHTNPELLEYTRAESGQNLVSGFRNWCEDLERLLRGGRPAGAERFEIGKQVAVTPGKVVFRNRLIELIQYSAQTPSVHAEPLLIVPAWIMKYYILDLSPQNSLVRYLVEHGHTVFMISWKNPTAADSNVALDDYLQLGFREALQAVGAIVPDRKVHAVGYCIGGTLLTIAAAALRDTADPQLASLSLLASLADFSEPGELSVFISPSQLAMLEGVMYSAGVLSSARMAAAFTLLRAKELLWGPAIDAYVRGIRPELNDLMAWNADGTRMPCRMHSEYLNRLYLKNELARGEFTVAGHRIALSALHMPMFVVGTETDHVAPWQAVYKIRGLTQSPDYTFLLTSGGHNGGIVSGPVNSRRRYRQMSWRNGEEAPTPEEWARNASQQPGSWWPAWERWLAAHSSPKRGSPPAIGNRESGYPPLEDAPGHYVHE